MIVSNAFKNDTLSKNTQIIPLVVIEKFISEEIGTEFDQGEITYDRTFISTNNIEVDGNYFKPLLLNIPRINQKVDLSSKKYQVSSVTLEISNTDYNNSKRLSEKLDSYSLINSVVCIYYKSPSCTTIQIPNQDGNGIVEDNIDTEYGCPRVFTGIIRDVSHTLDNITLSLEDITDKKIDKDLPIAKVGSGNNVPNKYKDLYYPMLFGNLENAPTIGYFSGGRFTFKADFKPIYGLNEEELQFEGIDSGWTYNTLKVFIESYVPLTKYAHLTFGEQNSPENPIYIVTANNRLQYNINDNNSLSFKTTSMFSVVDRIEAVHTGKPQTIILNEDINAVINSGNTDGETFYGIDNDNGGNIIQHITDDDYSLITDDDYNTSVQKFMSNYFDWTNEAGDLQQYGGAAHSLLGTFSLQWDSGISAAKYVRVIQNKINGIRIPVKGDLDFPSNGTGQWDNQFGWMWITDIPEVLEDELWSVYYAGIFAYDIDYSFQADERTTFTPPQLDFYYGAFTDLVSFGDGNTFNWFSEFQDGDPANILSYNENADIKIVDSINQYESYNYADVWSLMRLSDGNNANPQCGDGWSSLEVFTHLFTDGLQPFIQNNLDYTGAEVLQTLDITLKEIDVMSVVNFDRPDERNYYLNALGRADEFLRDYEHILVIESPPPASSLEYQVVESYVEPSPIIKNPTDIVRHILVEECGLTNDEFDEDEFNTSWCEHCPMVSNINHDYSIVEKINSKELFSEISKNSMLIPRIKNNGKVGFITTKSHYYYLIDYAPALEIDLQDIISYNFSLTPISDLSSKLDVSYTYDYEHKKTSKTTDPIEMNEAELDFYGINNTKDNYINIDSKYIQEKTSAENLRNLKFYNQKAQHLQIELKLPLSYISLEAGDLVKFPKDRLIDGIKAHGIDYTNFVLYGGVGRYPLFQVISVQRNLDFITIKLNQLHVLANYSETLAHYITKYHLNGYFPNANLNDPVYAETPYEEDLGYEIVPSYTFLIGHDSGFAAGDVEFLSSHSRQFQIIDLTIGVGEEASSTFPNMFVLKDRLELILGLNNFDISSWDSLFPSANDDGSGYGNILNGSGSSNVGGFIAMELRMINSIQSKRYILSLRNIAGTEFDSDIYDPSWTDIPSNITPSTTELKLGWVLYNAEEDWFYGDIYEHPVGGLGHIDDNLILHIHPTVPSPNELQAYTMLDYNMILYPYHNPIQDLQLEYLTDVEIQLLANSSDNNGSGGSSSPISGDINYDGIIDITDLVLLVNLIMDDDYTSSGDMNEDGILNVFDIILMVNLILGDS